jgi:hypothetical protein
MFSLTLFRFAGYEVPRYTQLRLLLGRMVMLASGRCADYSLGLELGSGRLERVT